LKKALQTGVVKAGRWASIRLCHSFFRGVKVLC
jgi:hypothetical protein